MVQSWNDGLRGGIWEFFSSTVCIGVAYLCLALCLSEMSTSLPFSSGIYGFVRVTISPFWGFMVALCEVIQTILYVASTVIPLGGTITEATGFPMAYEPLYWFIFFLLTISINIFSTETIFWRFITVLASISLILMLIYVLGSLGQVDFNEYATANNHTADGDIDDSEGEQEVFLPETMVQNLPLSCWFFVGIEILPLAASQMNVVSAFLSKLFCCCLCMCRMCVV
jgi:amino acid transporter